MDTENLLTIKTYLQVFSNSPNEKFLLMILFSQVKGVDIDYLLSPITRIAASNTPAPFAPVMEKFYIPQPERIAQAVSKLINV